MLCAFLLYEFLHIHLELPDKIAPGILSFEAFLLKNGIAAFHDYAVSQDYKSPSYTAF